MEEVLIERPRDPEVSRWLGRLEYETGRYAEAIRHFEAIRTDNPLDPDYLELIGICHFKLGERRRALDFLQLSSRLKLPDRDGAQILGELLEAEGLPGQAADWLLRVHGSEPREAPARERARIGRLLAESGRAEEAAAWLGALSEDEDQYSEAQSLLGPVYLALARVDEAAAALENARRLRPQDGPAQLAAGDLQLQRGDLKLALDAYAKASGLPRTQARGLAGLAEVAYAAGNLQAAVAYYEKAVAAGPGEARFQRVLERLQQELRVQREEEAGAAAGEPPADGERAAGG
jgi:tetratricopeptide (TPR) repeat protein